MKLLHVVFTIVLCVSVAGVSAQIDLSKAKQYQTVWRVPLGSESGRFAYNSEFCEFKNFNVLTGGIRYRGKVTWSTFPKLDTVNIFNWFQINTPAYLFPIDYDGLPPLEYINALGIVWRCSQGASPFPLVPIDTVTYDVCAGDPELSGDVNGDGYLDVVTGIGGASLIARVVLGGPQFGKGCSRVIKVEVQQQPGKQLSRPVTMYQSIDGGWVMIQQEQDHSTSPLRPVIYDLTFITEGGTVRVEYTRREENTTIIGFSQTVDVVTDTIAKKDYAVVFCAVGSPLQWGIASFDITNRTFVPTGNEAPSMYIGSIFSKNLGYSLGTDVPVIQVTSDSGALFCRIDNLKQPIARYKKHDENGGAEGTFAVINDQTGDGIPDIVSTTEEEYSFLRLMTIDTSLAVGVRTDPPSLTSASASLVGWELSITSGSPGIYSVELSDLRGVHRQIIPPSPITQSSMRVDLTRHLDRLPSAAYIIHVRVLEEEFTIKFVR